MLRLQPRHRGPFLLKKAGRGQFIAQLFPTWSCRLTHVEVLCAIPSVQTRDRSKGKIFPQALQLINAAPSFESRWGGTEVMLCADQCTSRLLL